MMHFEHLFKPITVGRLTLPHRIAMSPMARFRCGTDGVPKDIVTTYFRQRASAGLVMADSVYVDVRGRMSEFLGGMVTDEQQLGWSRVAAAVHEMGGRIFIQLIHSGRVSHPDLQPDGGPAYAPSAILPTEKFSRLLKPTMPRALTTAEVRDLISSFGRAAGRAVDAGFDGIELHGANGYLVSQFLSPGCNQRTDAYGGSAVRRARFAIETIDTMASIIGADRIGIKLSPGFHYHDIVDADEDVIETHAYLLRQLDARGLSHVHIQMPFDFFDAYQVIAFDQCKLVRDHFDGVVFASGGLTRGSADAGIAARRFDVAAFGRRFIANPDLPERFRRDLPENAVDMETLHTTGPKGYIDYPCLP